MVNTMRVVSIDATLRDDTAPVAAWPAAECGVGAGQDAAAHPEAPRYRVAGRPIL